MKNRKILKRLKQQRTRNRKLVKKYPFLGNDWSKYEKRPDCTEYDFMPRGWRRAFGKLMLDDIERVLEKVNYQKEYRVVEVKEKYGGLRWYDDGAPGSIYSELCDVIGKYEHVSQHVCISCGHFPAAMTCDGWWLPLCKKCYDGDDYDTWEETFDPYYKYITGNNNTEVKIDTSDIINRIKPRYRTDYETGEVIRM